MVTVFIPPQLKEVAGGIDRLDVDATSIRKVIAELDARFPGMADRLCQGDELRPGLSVSVDGRVSSLGLLQKLTSGAEVHFIPAIGGG